jgi:hypothetical protein
MAASIFAVADIPTGLAQVQHGTNRVRCLPACQLDTFGLVIQKLFATFTEHACLASPFMVDGQLSPTTLLCSCPVLRWL